MLTKIYRLTSHEARTMVFPADSANDALKLAKEFYPEGNFKLERLYAKRSSSKQVQVH